MVDDPKPVAVSIVIPCYGSEQTLEPLVARLAGVLAPRGKSYEIVLVNDGSPDGVWDVIRELAGRYPAVRGLDLLFNTGQYRATLCGLEHARGEALVTMDDDLQHPPEAVPALLNALSEDPECDCVMAVFPRKARGCWRRLGSAVMGRVYEVFHGKPRGLQASSFRALRRPLAEAIRAHRTANPNVNALIFQSTRRIAGLQVEHQPRPRGRSGYSLLRLARIMADNVLSVSTLPLKCVSMLGLAAAAGSFLLGSYYLARYFASGFQVRGFATLVLLIIFFGGMSLFSIGLLGEYVIRILEEVRPRPRYVVRDDTGLGRDR